MNAIKGAVPHSLNPHTALKEQYHPLSDHIPGENPKGNVTVAPWTVPERNRTADGSGQQRQEK
jgi:hypothetical protein